LHGIEDPEGLMRTGSPASMRSRKDRAARACSSGGAFAAPQEMENKHDQSDDQQDVNEAGANVKCEKAKQPENNQNQGDKSEHSFASCRARNWECYGSPSGDGRCPKGHHPREF